MQTDQRRVPKRRLRLRASNPVKCLLCYLAAFGLPLLWQHTALVRIYPHKLASTAPDAAGRLLGAVPALDKWLKPIAARTAENASALHAVLAAREESWLAALAVCAAAAWLGTLLLQLLWRVSSRKTVFAARATIRAIRSYRLTMLLVLLWNAALAAAVWFFGVKWIPGRTMWDYVVSFGVFALLPPAAALVSRLAASPAISGKHAFFKRL